MGGAMVASDSWYTAVYYNPAGMAYQEDVGLSVGVNYLNNFPKLNIDFGEEQIDRGERDQGLAIGFSTPLGDSPTERIEEISASVNPSTK